MHIPPLMACPLCSVPPRLVVRIWIVAGARSGKPIAAGCPHICEVFPGLATIGDTPERLAEKWNLWAADRLTEVLARYPAEHVFRSIANEALKAE
jgi:hypothetical protein